MSGQVWAYPVCGDEQKTRLTVVFTTTPEMAHNPVALTLWAWHARMLVSGELVPQSPVDHAMYRWMHGQVMVGQVTQITRRAEAGLDLFGADLPLDPRLVGPNYTSYDHNGAMLWLDLRSPTPVLLNEVGSQAVALERLKVLFARGARPVLGARVQANRAIYGPGEWSGHPGLALFTFDPTVQPAWLEQLAEYVKDLENQETNNPVLRDAVALVLANQEDWRYCRRARIPAELTGGHVIYVGDIWLHRQFLADGHISSRQPRALPFLADPGETGGLELIPFDRIDHFWHGPQGNAFRPRG